MELSVRQELEQRYAWMGAALQAACDDGKINSEKVRFFIVEQPPILTDENDEPILDADGKLQYDYDAEPLYFGRCQAYSYLGPLMLSDPSTIKRTTGQVDLSLQLLERAERETIIAVTCQDLNADFERAMVK